MKFKALIFACLLLVTGCGEHEVEFVPSHLFRTIPSDAVELMRFDRLDEGLTTLLDSSDVFRALDFGALSSSEMVLSYHYAVKLIPLLAVDATSKTVSQFLLDKASELGLKTRTFGPSELGDGHSALLLSTSETVLDAASEHVSAGQSIHSAKDFDKAALLSAGAPGSIFLKSEAASRFIPKTFLSEFIPRRNLVSSVKNLSSWTVLNVFEDSERCGCDIRFVAEDDRCFATVLDRLPGGECHLANVLPEEADWCVDIPLSSLSAYTEAYDNFLDAQSVLTKRSKRRGELARAAGKSPARWASDYELREVATIRWNNHKVNLVRPAVAPTPSEIVENRYAGFPAELFGSVFALDDETCSATYGEWIVTGSHDDIAEFIDCFARFALLRWPDKGTSFAIYTPGKIVYKDDTGVKLDVYTYN